METRNYVVTPMPEEGKTNTATLFGDLLRQLQDADMKDAWGTALCTAMQTAEAWHIRMCFTHCDFPDGSSLTIDPRE